MEPKKESLLGRIAKWVWKRPKPIDNGSQPKPNNTTEKQWTVFVMWLMDDCARALSPYVPGAQRLHFLNGMHTLRKVACINKTCNMAAQGTNIFWLQIISRCVHHSPIQMLALSEEQDSTRTKEIIYCMHWLALITNRTPHAMCVWLSDQRNMVRAYHPTIEGPVAHASLASLGMRMHQNHRNILVQDDNDGYKVSDVFENMEHSELWDDYFMAVEDIGYGLVQFSLRTSIVLWDDKLQLSWFLQKGWSEKGYTVWNGAAQPTADDSHLLFFNGSLTERCVDIIAEQGDALGLEIHGLPFSPVRCGFRVATSATNESGRLVYTSMTEEVIESDLQKVNKWILAITNADEAHANGAVANGSARA